MKINEITTKSKLLLYLKENIGKLVSTQQYKKLPNTSEFALTWYPEDRPITRVAASYFWLNRSQVDITKASNLVFLPDINSLRVNFGDDQYTIYTFKEA